MQGVTIKVNATKGTVRVYASSQTTTPNKAFYDFMIETSGYSDIYLDPHNFHTTIGENVYIAVEGVGMNNNFTFISEQGDTSIGDYYLTISIYCLLISFLLFSG